MPNGMPIDPNELFRQVLCNEQPRALWQTLDSSAVYHVGGVTLALALALALA